MNNISKMIVKCRYIILIISIALFVLSFVGIKATKINYDILLYLPKDVDTIKGQEILVNDFDLGSYAFVMMDDKNPLKILELEEDIKNINGVKDVMSIYDILDISIPKEILPDAIKDRVSNGDETIIFVSFKDSSSSDSTLSGICKLRELVKDKNKISSLSAFIIDTRELSEKEIFAYVLIAVLFCIIILTISTDSYIIPYLLLGNIGVAIIYNMGTNFILGQISYITKAISAVLQLGVTTDFSIFLYEEYQTNKLKYDNKNDAMAISITNTFKSILGSSLTTFAGFLALCTMNLTLGKDIGIVMAKGVLIGLITVVTLFPAFILIFDKMIDKTKHKKLIPTFKKIPKFIVKNYKIILVIFVILIIPAYIGNNNYKVYYELNKSLPPELPFNQANIHLKENYNIISPTVIIVDKNMNEEKMASMANKIKKLNGVDMVLYRPSDITMGFVSLLPEDFNKILANPKYQVMMINSLYPAASPELNQQLKNINKIVKSYDKNGLVAGEGALMNDLVEIADHDFKTVNYTSLIAIFLIMLLVLKSPILTIILTLVIEFAIFANMGFAYYNNTELPFVASICVGTIQLGATIDYAILMSTTYITNFSKMHDKKKAMVKTLENTIPSIIISALCFFAATVSVSIYTKIDMIGSICTLLARGSLISMVSVINILPPLLMVFNKYIMKGSLKNEKAK